jgi:hypothetical protein
VKIVGAGARWSHEYGKYLFFMLTVEFPKSYDRTGNIVASCPNRLE